MNLIKNKMSMFMHKMSFLVMLQMLFFLAVNFLVNAVRLYFEIKHGWKTEKSGVVYHEHASHHHHNDHHFDDDDHLEHYHSKPWWGRAWKVDKENTPVDSESLAQKTILENAHNYAYSAYLPYASNVAAGKKR